MRLLLSAFLILSACTFRVEQRSDAQIERDDTSQYNKKRVERCKEQCVPFPVAAFEPFGQCICGADKVNE